MKTGLFAPVELERVRDGDTVVVRTGSLSWAIRLIDCWVPERGETARKAASFTYNWCSANKELIVHIPWPSGKSDNVLSYLTFDRIPGHLYANGESLAEALVERGLAGKTKEEQPE